jgi:hypothetical protein
LSALAFQDAGVRQRQKDLLKILLRGIAARGKLADLQELVFAVAPVAHEVAEDTQTILALSC